jgi:hypothetical protein
MADKFGGATIFIMWKQNDKKGYGQHRKCKASF